MPILVDEAPSDELIADGVDPRLLGLFQGTPLPEGGDLAPSVTAIWLFRRNLMQLSESRDDVVEEVRITVLHETAHYFGMDEADLEELGSTSGLCPLSCCRMAAWCRSINQFGMQMSLPTGVPGTQIAMKQHVPLSGQSVLTLQI